MGRDGGNNKCDTKMKKVEKVSIGNIAFNMEESAHTKMAEYLDILSAYYGQKESGEEIIEGIEERIAELLVERGCNQRVVSLEDVENIMSILGLPEEIEDGSQMEEEPKESPKKKLYRNLQDKKLGGVCSGIASYFGIDPSLVRIIAFVLGVVAAFSSDGAGLGMIILLYFMLWVIIPGAKTVEQRCRMKGEGASVDSIERKVSDGVNEIVKSEFGTQLARVFKIVVGGILSIIGFIGLGLIVLAILGIGIADIAASFSAVGALSLISGISTTQSVLIGVLLVLVSILPFVGMLYGGIMLLFGFKSPKWKPGLVNFIVWIISCVALIGSLAGVSKNYWEKETHRDAFLIQNPVDTIYVKYADIDKCKGMLVDLDADKNEYQLYYVNMSKDNFSAIAYPELHLRRRVDDNWKIDSQWSVFTRTVSFDEWRGTNREDIYNYTDSTLTLFPIVYDGDNPIKIVERDVYLTIPNNVVVIVQEPIYHEFNASVKFSDRIL